MYINMDENHPSLFEEGYTPNGQCWFLYCFKGACRIAYNNENVTEGTSTSSIEDMLL